ncbi:MAG: hypothetical protein R3308_04825 [Thiohalobacterales bacterium]|nr:hypothetical protein [Thiohalobacterales bacterium]
MKSEIILLRLSYWIAALADFGIAVAVLMPAQMGVAEIVYPMGLMSAVAFSWGILLLFADRRPLERRWILPPTILVVALLSTVRVVFAVNGAIEFSLAYLLFGVCLIILLTWSYLAANRLAART